MRLDKHYDAVITDGSDESIASARVTLKIFEHVRRLGLHVDVPRGTRPSRRDAYTAQLEQQVQAMNNNQKTTVRGSPVWRQVREMQ